MLEIHVRSDSGLRTERSLNPDDCLSKLKTSAVWANQLVEERSSDTLQGEVQGSGAVAASPVVSSPSQAMDKGVWELQGFIVQHHDHTCLERLTEVFRLLTAGAAGEACSSSVMPWDGLVLAAKASGCACPILGVPESCTALQNAKIPTDGFGSSSTCPALGPGTAKLFLCHSKAGQ